METCSSLPSSDDVIFVGFNQDASSIAVARKEKYCLYTFSPAEELKRFIQKDTPNVCIIERLFSSSLVAIVSQNAPRYLRLCHFQGGTDIERSYSNKVLNIRLNRLRIIVVLEDALRIYDIRGMKELHTISHTPSNPQGICELTPHDHSYIAYQSLPAHGQVQIFDAVNLLPIKLIDAHTGTIAALKFTYDGSKLATASEKGTVLRVFGVPSGDKLYEFRRGVKRCVAIQSLAFSRDALFLSASSNTETIHVFKLASSDSGTSASSKSTAHDDASVTPKHPQHNSGESAISSVTSAAAGWLGYVTQIGQSYMPAQVTGILYQDRAFATAYLPHAGSRTVVGIVLSHRRYRLLAASYDGHMYVYDLDAHVGGECALLNQLSYYNDDEPTSLNCSNELNMTSANSGNNSTTNYAIAASSLPNNTSPGCASPDQSKAVEQVPKQAVDNAIASRGDAKESATLEREVDNLAPHPTGLRMDDSTEFPPMSHETDPPS